MKPFALFTNKQCQGLHVSALSYCFILLMCSSHLHSRLLSTKPGMFCGIGFRVSDLRVAMSVESPIWPQGPSNFLVPCHDITILGEICDMFLFQLSKLHALYPNCGKDHLTWVVYPCSHRARACCFQPPNELHMDPHYMRVSWCSRKCLTILVTACACMLEIEFHIYSAPLPPSLSSSPNCP